MPNEIKITVIWDEYNMSMSSYSLYREEMQEIHRVYNLGQLELFSIVGVENIIRWISEVFMRTPAKIFIDKVIF